MSNVAKRPNFYPVSALTLAAFCLAGCANGERTPEAKYGTFDTGRTTIGDLATDDQLELMPVPPEVNRNQNGDTNSQFYYTDEDKSTYIRVYCSRGALNTEQVSLESGPSGIGIALEQDPACADGVINEADQIHERLDIPVIAFK